MSRKWDNIPSLRRSHSQAPECRVPIRAESRSKLGRSGEGERAWPSPPCSPCRNRPRSGRGPERSTGPQRDSHTQSPRAAASPAATTHYRRTRGRRPRRRHPLRCSAHRDAAAATSSAACPAFPGAACTAAPSRRRSALLGRARASLGLRLVASPKQKKRSEGGERGRKTHHMSRHPSGFGSQANSESRSSRGAPPRQNENITPRRRRTGRP